MAEPEASRCVLRIAVGDISDICHAGLESVFGPVEHPAHVELYPDLVVLGGGVKSNILFLVVQEHCTIHKLYKWLCNSNSQAIVDFKIIEEEYIKW